jgi:threonine dehydrogenase-like Zn-dependent dehydrogenase
MLAAVFKRRGVLEIEDRPQPKGLGEEEVLLEVEGSGVCGTDLHILSDPPGHRATEGVILGHEIVARVIAKGSRVQQFDVGTRVVVDPNLKCGVCLACRKGQPNQCENGTTIGISLDGGFTRFVKAPQKALHPIREDVPLKEESGASYCHVFSARPSGSESNLDRLVWSLELVQPGSCTRCCLKPLARKS